MKFTFVLPRLSVAGGIRVVAEYGRNLIQMGHDVTFISRRNDAGMKSRIRRWLSGAGETYIPEYFEGMADRVTFVTSRRPIMSSDLPDADFLIATWWEAVESIRHMPERKGRKVHLMQGYGMFDWVPHDRVAATYDDDHIKIAVSEWTAEKVLEMHGKRSDAVIPNAIDAERFPFKEKPHNPTFRLGFVYSPANIKNCQLVINAKSVLDRRGFNTDLVSFHSKPMPKAVRRVHDIESHVRPPHEQIVSIYQSCDLWLFPSLMEGFGMPILEALSCGTPVLATHAGAAPQLIRHGENGYLAAADPEAFADLIIEHAGLDAVRKRQMSLAARESVVGWDWAQATQALVDVLSSHLKRAA